MNKDRLREITLTSIRYRGEFLEKMTWLEKCLETYISSYFIDDKEKRIELELIVLGDLRITLENKRAIFYRIAESKDSEWIRAYKSKMKFKREKKVIEMNKDLVYVLEQRNILAHLIPNTTNDAIEISSQISYVRSRDSIQEYIYTPEKFNELTGVVSSLITYLMERINKNQQSPLI